MAAGDTLIGARFQALREVWSFTGAMPEMLLAWLRANGATATNLPDAWLEFLLQYPPLTNATVFKELWPLNDPPNLLANTGFNSPQDEWAATLAFGTPTYLNNQAQGVQTGAAGIAQLVQYFDLTKIVEGVRYRVGFTGYAPLTNTLGASNGLIVQGGAGFYFNRTINPLGAWGTTELDNLVFTNLSSDETENYFACRITTSSTGGAENDEASFVRPFIREYSEVDTTSQWTVNSAHVEVIDHQVRLTNRSDSFGHMYAPFTAEVGKTYRVTVPYTAAPAIGGILGVGTATNARDVVSHNLSNGSGLGDQTFIAPATQLWVSLWVNNPLAGPYVDYGAVVITDISTRKSADEYQYSDWWYDFLGQAGFTQGHVNDRERLFWQAGGFPPGGGLIEQERVTPDPTDETRVSPDPADEIRTAFVVG